ncbi:MAG: hypothetical protein A4E63_00555 [Syntrophorhabdus sp. PtaU1.Bin050]|nr:MAG: hypothetical protein A4E63_00555 [Syntrophorhabdus sp. PtaU1.Bin050]
MSNQPSIFARLLIPKREEAYSRIDVPVFPGKYPVCWVGLA